MPLEILLPKRGLDRILTEIQKPLFFLAGPVRGGNDWQMYMAFMLQELSGGCTCVIPCRWDKNHRMKEHFVGAEDLEKYPYQLAWEEYWLDQAGLHARQGCIVFWLGLESKTNPHPGPEPYAMDTRRELGMWAVLAGMRSARVVIGAHPDFLGLSQIQRTFSTRTGYDFPSMNR